MHPDEGVSAVIFMDTSLRIAARWLLVGLFAAVSIGGQGLSAYLHESAGRWHGHSKSERSHQSARCHDSSEATCPEPHFRGEDGQPHAPPHHDDDCVICRFFAQGQLVAAELDFEPQPFTVLFRVERIVAPTLSVIEPYNARGPPSGTSRSC